MKKIISLIAIVIALVVFSTNAFAFAGAVSSEATLDGTVISVAADKSFVFKFVGDQEISGGSSIKINVANLVNAGWTVEAVNGAWSGSADATASFANNLIQVGWAAGSNYDLTDVALIQFKATPAASVNFDTASFKVQPTIRKVPTGLYATQTTYTLAEAAAQNTPATVSAPNMAWAEYTVGNTLYKGIWTGAYTVTAGTKKVDDITVAVNGAAAESLDVEAEAGATVDFKIAVIGKPALDATGIVVTAVEAQ